MVEKSFPKIMGIVNVTPDSFSDGSLFLSPENAIRHGLSLIEDGADILDVGGESSRPGSEPVSEEEEIKRVIPVIKGIRKENKEIPISIDTVKYNVAKEALEAGATIINDISALRVSPGLADLAAQNDIPLILMHMQGNPKNMQSNPVYDNVVTEVFDFLKERIEFARSQGVNKIYGDIGIGFGKTVEHNLELLRNYSEFSELKVPMVLGISRKAFIGKILKIDNPADRDAQTALFYAFFLKQKKNIFRVHNVKIINDLKRIFFLF